MYLNKIIDKFQQRQVRLMGCKSEEIDSIKQLAKKTLPVCYLEFLRTMGKGMSEDIEKSNYYEYGSFVGTAVFFEDLFDNKEGAIELLNEDGSNLILTEDDFVFYDSQGILFAFFKLSEGDNPPVYFYREGSGQTSFIKTADTLSSFYERYLEGDANLFKV